MRMSNMSYIFNLVFFYKGAQRRQEVSPALREKLKYLRFYDIWTMCISH